MGCRASTTKVEAPQPVEEMIRTPKKKRTQLQVDPSSPEGPMLLGKEDSASKLHSNTKSEQALSCSKSLKSSERSSRRSSRQGTLYRERTTAFSAADMSDLDVMVLSYSCSNENTNKALGAGCYEATWKVQMGQNPLPLVIRLDVDKSIPGTPNVRITSNGECIFPLDSTCTMAKIKGDFQQKWNFIGTIEGMYEINHFEMRAGQNKEWLRATMIGETAEGCYEMEAEVPYGEGDFQQVVFPSVNEADIRYAGSHKALSARERFLMLEVPAQDPLHAVLSVDDCELVTHYFARPSPPLGAPCRSLHLQVSEDRSHVVANMGHSALTEFAKGEVKAVNDVQHYDAEDVSKHSWMIQVGHFAEHTIQLEESQPENGHYTLVVDGEPLVEASIDDLDRDDDHWQCTFHLVGQRSIDFDMHEMREDGSPLKSIGRTTQRQNYFHECCVTVQSTPEGKMAELCVDGIELKALPQVLASQEEALVHATLEDLQSSYGINVPHKVPCRKIVDIDDSDARDSSCSSKVFQRSGSSRSSSAVWTCFGVSTTC